MDDVYERLKALKIPDESFSDEIRRLTETKRDIMQFAGMWKDIDDKRAEEMKKAILSLRGGTRTKENIKKFKQK